MRVEVLVSTMNQETNYELQKRMNLYNNYVIINQITKKDINIPQNLFDSNKKFISYNGKGLSKSRNKAIENSTADICALADDDMYYEKDYEKKIIEAYKKYKDADIIAFVVEHEDKTKEKKILKEGKIGFLKSMKISSVQITFKRTSICNKNILFNENFGAGEKYYLGEENIFLAHCLKKGLKIYYVPVKIATLRISESTWFKGHTENNYNISGAVYYEMSKYLYPILIIQFVLRKKWMYGKYLKPRQVMKYMFEGVKKYKKDIKKHIYFMGDFCSNTGPAMVNKGYYPYMKDKSYICRTNSKIIRLLHFIIHIITCNTLLISGLSKFHVVAAKLAKKLGKRVIYLMHGYAKKEQEINKLPEEKEISNSKEETMLKIADKIICVSENFYKYMKNERKDIANKFEFVNNGIEITGKILTKKNKNDKIFTIISVGGGVRNKNNLTVCEAISKIKDIDIKFIIIGKLGIDGEKIKEYNFVEYYESLPHDEVVKKMKDADLYIQNSYFETFGLSIVEAISMRCKILISENIGMLSLINNINDNMIIHNNNDIYEIKSKIEFLLKNDTINTICINGCGWKETSKKLIKLL